MAQIIKHRRGSISQLKDVTAKAGELVMATGSINDLNGPFIFIGESENAVGGYRPVSKLYSGNQAPTISSLAYGTVLDGTPYYSVGNETLYILASGGNTALDLTGNIEGNTISGVTINNLVSTNISASFFTGSFKGDGSNLINIPATGVTGLNLSMIASGAFTASISDLGGFNVNTNTSITGSVNISGDTSITGALVVSNGSATFDNGLVAQNSDLLLTSGSNLIIQDNGNLQVAGNAAVSGALYVSGNIYQTGSFYTQGDIILSGSINIGNSLTGDTINFGGEVNSHIIPTTNNTYDLGTTTKAWKDLYVSGTAYIENISLAGISVNSLALPGDLTVSGTTTLSGSVFVEDLTDNRIVLAGVGGELEDDANLTFDGTTFKIGNGDFEVDVLSGDTRMSGSLIVKNSATVTGSLYTSHVLGTGSLYLQPDQNDARLFEIYNSASPNGTDVHFKGNADFNFFGDDTNYLAIDDNAQTVSITGVNGVFVSSSLTVTGSVTLNNNLSVSGTTTLYDATTINDNLTVTGNTQVQGNTSITGAFTVASGSMTSLGGDLYVSGNLQVLGSSTEVHLQSQTIELDDNIIRLNAYSPFQRYAGFEVIDSGSTGESGSMVWDSQNDYWMFVSSSGQSSKFVGTTAGTYGSETSLTSGTFPIASASNTIGDSLLTYSGTTLAFNTNKFTIDSGNGNTMVSGNVTLSYSGGTDSGSYTSNIVFRNDNDVLGFVGSNDTTNVTDRLLGYNSTTGVLEFSSLIDGGTY